MIHGVFEEILDVEITPKTRFKVALSEPDPVITLAHGRPQIGMMNFGLKTAKGRHIMAHGETVAELRTFREAFRQRRCLIIAHGFYDSLDMGAFRQPWHIHLKGDGVMCFAGLWESHPDTDSFTIVSAPANPVVARVIDRMSVILPEESWKPWLDVGTSVSDLQSMLNPYPAEFMESWPVTRQVNQRGIESPQCIVPVAPAQGELGLNL